LAGEFIRTKSSIYTRMLLTLGGARTRAAAGLVARLLAVVAETLRGRADLYTAID
jgi:hypothetical protein